MTTSYSFVRIQLTVVSGPPEDSQDLECEEVGYAYVDVREMLEKGQDVIEQDIDSKSSDKK